MRVITSFVAISLLFLISGCSKEPTSTSTPLSSDAHGGKPKIVFIFKVGGISYSDACKAGAEEANSDKAVGAKVEYEAPDQASAGKQADIIDQARVGGANAIVISPDDAEAVVPALNRAVDSGIQTFTWDSDAPASKRKFYVAAVDDVQIGADIADALAKSVGEKGKVLIFSGQRTAENLNKHVQGMIAEFKKYPNITVVQPVYYNDDDKTKAVALAVQALQANPDAVGIACANSVSPPSAGEALRKLSKVGKIKVWGLALPSETKTYIEDGSVTGLYLWDPKQLTFLTAELVSDALKGKMPVTGETLPGMKGTLKVNGPIVTLPIKIAITKQNIDQFNF